MSAPLFRCGHARSPENTVAEQGRIRCKTCYLEKCRRYRAEADPNVRRMEYRQRYLPIALERTREKLRELEREARALGLTELLEQPRRLTGNQILTNTGLIDQAWEREAEIARIMGRL